MSFRRTSIWLAATVTMVFWASGALAATVVNVELWDNGAKEKPTGLTYGTPHLDLSKATMGIRVTRASAPAGVVTFKVTNTSKQNVHEMIVIHLKNPSQHLPYIAQDERVDEDKADGKGEVSELDLGQSGSLTVTLQPGKYLLICNVAGHYAAGMWTQFAVTK